jgi:hypothetical protein
MIKTPVHIEIDIGSPPRAMLCDADDNEVMLKDIEAYINSARECLNDLLWCCDELADGRSIPAAKIDKARQLLNPTGA